MTRPLLIISAVVAFCIGANAPRADAQSPPSTFNKDVLPILQNNCQGCHRPGQIAPMSLVTSQDARPWAKAIQNAVVTRAMPPWFADEGYGRLLNERRLKRNEIDAIARWADAGAAEGNVKDAPSPVQWPEG